MHSSLGEERRRPARRLTGATDVDLTTQLQEHVRRRPIMKIDPDLIKLEEEDIPVETLAAPGRSGVEAGPSRSIMELSAQMRAEEAEHQRLLARRNLLAEENSRLVSRMYLVSI